MGGHCCCMAYCPPLSYSWLIWRLTGCTQGRDSEPVAQWHAAALFCFAPAWRRRLRWLRWRLLRGGCRVLRRLRHLLSAGCVGLAGAAAHRLRRRDACMVAGQQGCRGGRGTARGRGRGRGGGSTRASARVVQVGWAWWSRRAASLGGGGGERAATAAACVCRFCSKWPCAVLHCAASQHPHPPGAWRALPIAGCSCCCPTPARPRRSWPQRAATSPLPVMGCCCCTRRATTPWGAARRWLCCGRMSSAASTSW